MQPPTNGQSRTTRYACQEFPGIGMCAELVSTFRSSALRCNALKSRFPRRQIAITLTPIMSAGLGIQTAEIYFGSKNCHAISVAEVSSEGVGITPRRLTLLASGIVVTARWRISSSGRRCKALCNRHFGGRVWHPFAADLRKAITGVQ